MQCAVFRLPVPLSAKEPALRVTCGVIRVARRQVRLAFAAAAYVCWRAPSRPVCSLRFVRQPKAGEGQAGEADAEFLQRRPAGD